MTVFWFKGIKSSLGWQGRAWQGGQGRQGHWGSPGPGQGAPAWAQAEAWLGRGSTGGPGSAWPMAGQGMAVGTWSPALMRCCWGRVWNGVLATGRVGRPWVGQAGTVRAGGPLMALAQGSAPVHVICSRPSSNITSVTAWYFPVYIPKNHICPHAQTRRELFVSHTPLNPLHVFHESSLLSFSCKLNLQI